MNQQHQNRHINTETTEHCSLVDMIAPPYIMGGCFTTFFSTHDHLTTLPFSLVKHALWGQDTAQTCGMNQQHQNRHINTETTEHCSLVKERMEPTNSWPPHTLWGQDAAKLLRQEPTQQSRKDIVHLKTWGICGRVHKIGDDECLTIVIWEVQWSWEANCTNTCELGWRREEKRSEEWRTGKTPLHWTQGRWRGRQRESEGWKELTQVYGHITSILQVDSPCWSLHNLEQNILHRDEACQNYLPPSSQLSII